MSDKILVPLDGSECSLRALDVAADLARATNARVVLCNVVDNTRAATMCFGEPQLVAGALDALREEGESVVATAKDRIAASLDADRVETRVAQGSTVEEILRLADETQATWIVMGSHGRNGVVRFVMGSIAEGVLHHANVPIIVVPPKRHSATYGKKAAAVKVSA